MPPLRYFNQLCIFYLCCANVFAFLCDLKLYDLVVTVMISSKTNWLPYCVIVAFSDFSAMSPNVSGTFHYLVRRGDNKKQHYRLQVMCKMDCDYLEGSELQKKQVLYWNIIVMEEMCIQSQDVAKKTSRSMDRSNYTLIFKCWTVNAMTS